MQNNFEKQVRDKMEELQFTPAAPVWQNIEKEIRPRERRRRLLFILLPLALLLLGGAGWWLSHKPAITPDDRLTAGQRPAPASQAAVPHPQGNASEATRPAAPKASETVMQEGADPLRTGAEQATASHARSATSNFPGMEAFFSAAGKPVLRMRITSPSISGGTAKTQPSGIRLNPADHSSGSGRELSRDGSTAANSTAPPTGLSSQDSAFNSNPAAPAETEKVPLPAASPVKTSSAKARGWQWGLLAEAGWSGIGKGFPFSMEKSLMADYTPSNTTGSGVASPIGSGFASGPSEVKTSLSLAFGLQLRKAIAPRWHLSTGLLYRQYSTSRMVGAAQDSLAPSGRTVQFYNGNGTSEQYTNRFHFVSLPVSIEWQVLKQWPLQLEAGLSLQCLLSTNALLYDGAAKVYYQNPDAFTRAQVFGEIGLSYPVQLKGGSSLLFGPKLQYGFTAADNRGSGERLYSAGIGARFFFGKK